MSIYKPKNSPNYHYDFELGGRRFHGSTKRTSEEEAQAMEDQKRKAARKLVYSQMIEKIPLKEGLTKARVQHARDLLCAAMKEAQEVLDELNEKLDVLTELEGDDPKVPN